MKKNDAPDSSLPSTRPIIGISLMLLSILIIPFSDGIMKYMSVSYSVVFVSWARFLAITMLMLPLAIHRRHSFLKFRFYFQTFRALFFVAALLLYFTAISRISLVDALGASLLAPIFATVLAVVFLKERLNLKKKIAIFLGFLGAVIVLRPGLSMDIGTIYALIAGFMYACFLVMTRMAVQTSSPFIILAFQSFVGTILLTPFALMEWEQIEVEGMALVFAMALISLSVNLLSLNAFRFAQASTLSPLVYFELVSATLIGFFFFKDFPDWITWLGISVIVIGGLSLIEGKK
ncbi:MAG: DMT family transporter [SAR324 cluster bacterium]|nr:DMT family transporter [SAR324 cluster bacterium]